ncbi:hypothetical protein CBP51_12355 [Cellvibrio mixtus]|uniref:Acyltransferase 3 domain-containing protein n=1 Tax=Cellvibrio mixtus TaxID=39650 RepID=A0A266QCV9_9GAMM|nr:acyltransferase [Cellvibrio mixtus]OZY87712.1 hypothetical protein CBP51_12355 [Cellvibrio mixtus]
MRLQALDLLRFIAALAVVAYHYLGTSNPSYPQLAGIAQFGYLGVPLFFMISGFVIASSAEQRSPLQFLISRATRLYPAFWIAVLFTSSVIWCLAPTKPSALQVLANLTMLNDYLGITNIDGVYWTLQVELKFYLCIFLLMALRLFHFYHLWLPLWIITTLSYLFSGHPEKMGWFISPGNSCYFISGVCLYLIWKKKHSVITNVALVLSTLLCTYQGYHQASDFMANSNSISWTIAGILIFIFHCLFLVIALHKLNIAFNPIYTLLGGITYPLYLLHNRAGKLFIDTLSPATGEALAILITTTLMLLLSYLIYRYAEPHAAPLLKRCLQQVIPHTRK